MDEARTTATVVSSIGGAPSKHRCLIGPVSTWASLPLDLLLEIFRRLESTAVIRCAAACRPWRRAIIGNASFLRPRPDRFLPSLLLGIYHGYGYYVCQGNGYYACQDLGLRRITGPLQSALPLNVPKAQSFIQDYGEVLSSRDDFILLRGRGWMSGLCLYNRMTGDCTFFPNATIKSDDQEQYILLTGYDFSLPTSGSRSDDDLAVRILAVDGSNKMYTEENRIKYQLTSSGGGGGAGVWGPIRRSMELQQGFRVIARDSSTAVCHDVVHWLGGSTKDDWRLTGIVALEILRQ